MTSKAQQRRDEQAEARTMLRAQFPAGSTVHTVIRHVSQSGMTRSISVLYVDDQGEIWDESGRVARALGWSFDDRRGGVKVNGAGMDMGFHLIYSLSQALYGAQEGYALKHRWV